jgi:hypothetical protein
MRKKSRGWLFLGWLCVSILFYHCAEHQTPASNAPTTPSSPVISGTYPPLAKPIVSSHPKPKESGEETGLLGTAELPSGYGHCVLYSLLQHQQPQGYALGKKRFEEGIAFHADHKYQDAAAAFWQAAVQMREKHGSPQDKTNNMLLKNRLVAYANSVNAYLSAQLVGDARDVLSRARTMEPALEKEFQIALDNLPHPMSCLLK